MDILQGLRSAQHVLFYSVNQQHPFACLLVDETSLIRFDDTLLDGLTDSHLHACFRIEHLVNVGIDKTARNGLLQLQFLTTVAVLERAGDVVHEALLHGV